VAVTDEEFGDLRLEVTRLDGRVRTLEDARAVDRAEAEIRHRAVQDSLQALRETQVEQGRQVLQLGQQLGQLRRDTAEGFRAVDQRFETVQTTLAHVVRLLGGEPA
jgi:DNA-binding protein H-NS